MIKSIYGTPVRRASATRWWVTHDTHELPFEPFLGIGGGLRPELLDCAEALVKQGPASNDSIDFAFRF